MTAPLTGPGRPLRLSSFALHCVAVGTTDCSAVEVDMGCPVADYRNLVPDVTISGSRASGGIGRRAGFRFL
jgi:hypothetical protein